MVSSVPSGSSGLRGIHFIPFLLLIGNFETDVPEPATHVLYSLVDLPSTLPLFFFSLVILTLFTLSTNGLVGVGGSGFGGVVWGGLSSSDNGVVAGVVSSQNSLLNVFFLNYGKGSLFLAASFL